MSNVKCDHCVQHFSLEYIMHCYMVKTSLILPIFLFISDCIRCSSDNGSLDFMSAFYPTSSGKTRLSETTTIGNNRTSNFLKCSPCSYHSIGVKSANKMIPGVASRNGIMTADQARKADPDTSYNAKPEFVLLDSMQRRPHDIHADAFGFGRLVENGLVFNQNFVIRSYEVGADQTASIETFINHLQETALNHGKLIGLQHDGFGCSPEMTKRNLIWVFSKLQLLVHRYPSWGEMVQVKTWLAPQGKYATRRDWHVRDYRSGRTILRATSLLVMMNRLTRKLAKIPDEVRKEWDPYLVDRTPIIDEDGNKLSNQEKSSDGNNAEKHLIRGLTPKRGDLDLNDHVNNVKYIGWILESAPMDILEKQELTEMTLEYRRECRKNDVIQSLTTVCPDGSDSAQPNSTTSIHCDHLLSLESGGTIVKAHSSWRPKRVPTRTT